MIDRSGDRKREIEGVCVCVCVCACLCVSETQRVIERSGDRKREIEGVVDYRRSPGPMKQESRVEIVEKGFNHPVFPEKERL